MKLISIFVITMLMITTAYAAPRAPRPDPVVQPPTPVDPIIVPEPKPEIPIVIPPVLVVPPVVVPSVPVVPTSPAIPVVVPAQSSGSSYGGSSGVIATWCPMVRTMNGGWAWQISMTKDCVQEML